MNTPMHATDEQIDQLWERAEREGLLRVARNFVQAYEALARKADEQSKEESNHE